MAKWLLTNKYIKGTTQSHVNKQFVTREHNKQS